MAAFTPCPFGALVRRMFRELDREDSIFGLPSSRFFRAPAGLDLSVHIHGRRAATPYGPAAGPHTQLAQNIVLSWLGGARVIELKTVQRLDRLAIPRPCIDMRTVGFNVEWSQELMLEESFEEYVKASMLIEMLLASGRLEVDAERDRPLLDMSIGYDWAGVSSPVVGRFLRSMMDAGSLVARLRGEIPDDCAEWRDVPFSSRISDSVTLSTFHGCSWTEIERIAHYLLREVGIPCVVKLNPTLLGAGEVRRLLGDVLGYRELAIPDAAFASDPAWDEALALFARLSGTAAREGRGFGLKLTNTLVVENTDAYFPASERVRYLSGRPLHMLAMHLVGRLRRDLGAGVPLSFSAGIDRRNFADAVSLGLAPVTVCTDLLRPGGYGRARGYLQGLAERMVAARARSVDEFVLRGGGHAERALAAAGVNEPALTACRQALDAGGELAEAAGAGLRSWVSEAARLNTAAYVERLDTDDRYARRQNALPPPKIGRLLWLFDCLTCDKCLPVCPNAAIFTFALPPGPLPKVVVSRDAEGWTGRTAGAVRVSEPHQIGVFADLCNDCGNCDVFCPEDGGPFRAKPRMFGSADAWRADGGSGFVFDRRPGYDRVLARLAGQEYEMEVDVEHGYAWFRGAGFDVRFHPADPVVTMEGQAAGDVDLLPFEIMNALRRGVLNGTRANWINTRWPA